MAKTPERSNGSPTRVLARLRRWEGLSGTLPPLVVGEDDLRADHPPLPLLVTARDGTMSALDRGETRYVDGSGISLLRAEVAKALKVRGLLAEEAGVLIAAGEQEARFLTIHALRRNGIRLVLPEIVHPGALKAAAVSGGVVARVRMLPGFGDPDPEDVRRVLRGGPPSVLYLESPNRFTGKTIGHTGAAAIASAAADAGALVIWDGSLSAWLPPDVSYPHLGAIPEIASSAITFGTEWAGAGLASWQIAYVSAPSDIFAHLRRLKQIMALCTSVPVQWGALAALRADGSRQTEWLPRLEAVRAEAVRELPEAVIPGEAVSHIAVHVSGRNGGRTPGRPGEDFGCPGGLRFTVTPKGGVISALHALAQEMRSASGPQ